MGEVTSLVSMAFFYRTVYNFLGTSWWISEKQKHPIGIPMHLPKPR